ncbi:MAG: DnaJ domain-containing protein [Kiritimatiellae bacterium]|nr:DnaJ domain-containing protein [Kiritimatiellia bacterium]
MNWQGKVIGGSLGSFFGPIGTLAGAAAGHFFVDRRRQQEELKFRRRVLALLSGALYQLAVADGAFSAAEERAVNAVLTDANEQLGRCMAASSLPMLMDQSRTIQNPLGSLILETRGHPQLSPRVLLWLLRVAAVDGDATEPELRILQDSAAQLVLPSDLVEFFFRLYLPVRTGDSAAARLAACKTLGVTSQASAEEIKKAFRELSMKYHPDRHAGLPEEIRALTAEKFQAVAAAYETLKRESQTTEDRWSRHPANGGLFRAKANEAVVCFCCGRQIRLSDRFDPIQSRCPICQAFLAYSRDFAEHLQQRRV